MKVIPNIFGNKTSNAERNIFQLLKSINFNEKIFHNYSVALHSLNLGIHEKKRWSEGDFVIISERGILLLEVEKILKEKIDEALMIWLEPVGDKSKLRNLRGIEIKPEK